MKQKLRYCLLLILLILIPAGLYTKFYTGPGQQWVASYAGDIFYPMFWFFLLLFINPNLSPHKAAISIFLFSTLVELSQLVTSPLLHSIRKTFIGRTLIGTQFVAMDIVYYLAGSLLALVIYKWLLHLFRLPLAPPEPQRHNNAL